MLPAMPLLRRLVDKLRPHRTNIFAVLVGQALTMLGMLAGNRLLTEVASKETFGEAKLVMGLEVLLLGILVNPLARYAQRELHDATQQERAAVFYDFGRKALKTLLAVLAPLFVVGLLIYSLVTGHPGAAACLFAGILLIADSSFNFDRGLLVSKNLQIAGSSLQVLRGWGPPLLACAAILVFGDEPAALLGGHALAFALAAWLALRVARAAIGTSATADAASSDGSGDWRRAALRFALPLVPVGLFGWVVNMGDRYLLAMLRSTGEAGQYAAVYGLILTPLGALGGITVTLGFPLWFRMRSGANVRGERNVRWLVLLTQLAVCFVVFPTVYFFHDWIALVGLSEVYRQEISEVMIWLAAGGCFFILAQACNIQMYADRRTWVMSVAYGAAAAVNVAANLVWIPDDGAVGAARATALTFAVYLTLVLALGFRGPAPEEPASTQ